MAPISRKRVCVASSTVSLNASKGEWPFSRRTLYWARKVPSVGKENVKLRTTDRQGTEICLRMPIQGEKTISISSPRHRAINSPHHVHHTDQSKPPLRLARDVLPQGDGRVDTMTLLKSVRTERPEPLGVTRMHRRPLEVRPWCPPCIRRRNCARGEASCPWWMSGVSRDHVADCAASESRFVVTVPRLMASSVGTASHQAHLMCKELGRVESGSY